jgi:gentisate 1,2-dioxygenase
MTDTDTAIARSGTPGTKVNYEQRGIIYRPEKAFDHGLPDVPVHAFDDELDRALDPATPSSSVPLDLSETLRLPYVATTPLFLAQYNVVRAADRLQHHLGGTAEVHYVLRGRGYSENRSDTINWSTGDCFCFPGGEATVHSASEDALLFCVTNEPELAFQHTVPAHDGPVIAALWGAGDIETELARVHATGGEQKTAGKSVSFTTAAMHRQLSGALTPSMMVAINTLEPGGEQRRHRHNSVAITVAIDCEGSFSLIGDQNVRWRRFGVIVTPPRLAHSHFNQGSEMMRSLVVQDGPVFYNCRSVGFEWTDEVF